MMQIVAGIDALDIPALIAESNQRVILHAAVYGPFSQSAPHREAFAKALHKTGFERLDIIALQDDQPWVPSFFQALRPESTPDEQVKTINASLRFIEELEEAYPERVHLYPLKTFPCQPILVIDDTVIFGQYAHCSTHAALGAWGIIKTDVRELFDWAEANDIPSSATNEEIAAYRLIAECRHAMIGGQK